MLDRNTWNHLTMCKQMSSNNLYKSKVINKVFAYKSFKNRIWYTLK